MAHKTRKEDLGASATTTEKYIQVLNKHTAAAFLALVSHFPYSFFSGVAVSSLLHKCSIFNASLAYIQCNLWLWGKLCELQSSLLQPYVEVKWLGNTPAFKDADTQM